MSRSSCLAFWSLLGLTALLLALPADATQLLRVYPQGKADYIRLLEVAPEATTCGVEVVGDAVEFAAEEATAPRLRSLGFHVEVVVEHLEDFYAARLGRQGDFGAYHTYTEAIIAMDALVAQYPNLISPKQSIGPTIEGREIWVYKISDNPLVDEPDEPEVFFNAYIHAREPITFEIVYDLAQTLLSGYGLDPRITEMVNTRQIWIQPCVNPDGVEYNRLIAPGGGGMWRKNRRNNGNGTWGVDLNRNFGYMWGYDNQGSSPNGSSETYRGTAAFSEPETSALRDFVNGRRFTTAVNNHSYGNWDLFAFGYDCLHAPDHDAMWALGRMRRAHSQYRTGTAWELLYATNGDANDWMYGEQGTKPAIFSFVTETGTGGDGFWPAESRIPTLVAENREPNLRLIELSDNPYRVLPPGTPFVASPDTVPTTFTLHWSVPQPDPDNPAILWNLMEATGHTVGADNVEGANQARWEADGWTWSNTRSKSPTHSWFSGNADGQNNVLISRRGHRVQPGEELRFWTWYNTENGYDYGYVEVATDARDFHSLPGSITTNSNPNNRNLGNGITGSTSNNWVHATFSLADYAGEVIWIRFRYNTDGYQGNGGWYVDDIEPSDLFATETLVATNHPVAQYTFTGHGEGTFAYLAQAVDAEGDVGLWGIPAIVTVSGAADVAEHAPAASAWKGLELAGGNPFSTAIPLRWTVPASARTGEALRLAVHDVSGREVALLRQGHVGAGASQGLTLEASWRPAGLPAGLYFARLTVGSRSSEQRLLYMK